MKKFLFSFMVLTTLLCLSVAGNTASLPQKNASQEMYTTVVILLPNGTVIILKT